MDQTRSQAKIFNDVLCVLGLFDIGSAADSCPVKIDSGTWMIVAESAQKIACPLTSARRFRLSAKPVQSC